LPAFPALSGGASRGGAIAAFPTRCSSDGSNDKQRVRDTGAVA
jgi:hypothetical protein